VYCDTETVSNVVLPYYMSDLVQNSFVSNLAASFLLSKNTDVAHSNNTSNGSSGSADDKQLAVTGIQK